MEALVFARRDIAIGSLYALSSSRYSLASAGALLAYHKDVYWIGRSSEAGLELPAPQSSSRLSQTPSSMDDSSTLGPLILPRNILSHVYHRRGVRIRRGCVTVKLLRLRIAVRVEVLWQQVLTARHCNVLIWEPTTAKIDATDIKNRVMTENTAFSRRITLDWGRLHEFEVRRPCPGKGICNPDRPASLCEQEEAIASFVYYIGQCHRADLKRRAVELISARKLYHLVHRLMLATLSGSDPRRGLDTR